MTFPAVFAEVGKPASQIRSFRTRISTEMPESITQMTGVRKERGLPVLYYYFGTEGVDFFALSSVRPCVVLDTYVAQTMATSATQSL
jgi:hypothetical protein